MNTYNFIVPYISGNYPTPIILGDPKKMRDIDFTRSIMKM